MSLFNSQTHLRGTGTTLVIELFTLLVLAFAVVTYVKWSSNASVAKFMSATDSSASDPKSPAQTQSLTGQTGCPLGKRSPPTQLMPLQ